MTQAINRRRALAVVAPLPAAAALGAVPAFGEPGELSALIRRYWAEIGAAFGQRR